MTKAFFLPVSLPVALLAAMTFFSAPSFAAGGDGWQVQKTAMSYRNSGMAQANGDMPGASAQVAFDPKRPDGGSFQLSFQTTGLFIPREAIGVRDPEKLSQIIQPTSPASFTAQSLKRSGDSISVDGSLTINGQTRPASFSMSVQESGNAGSGRSLQLAGTFMVNRPGFATKDVGYIGPANVPITFDVMATTQPAATTNETVETAPENAAMPEAATPPQGRYARPVGSVSQNGAAAVEDAPAKPEIGKVQSFGGAATGNDDTTTKSDELPTRPAPRGTVQTFGGSGE